MIPLNVSRAKSLQTKQSVENVNIFSSVVYHLHREKRNCKIVIAYGEHLSLLTADYLFKARRIVGGEGVPIVPQELESHLIGKIREFTMADINFA